MKEFNDLIEVANKLLGPNGCPWDKEQTFSTLQPYLLEEIHELLEAIDLQDPEKIKEELGDCVYTLLFIAKVAEQKQMFTLPDSIRTITEKLIRRHPHIFSELKIESTEEIMQNWETIKKKEGKKNPIEGIPPGLPALARAQKVISKMVRAKKLSLEPSNQSTEEIGDRIWAIIKEAESAGVDAESALRRACLKWEQTW